MIHHVVSIHCRIMKKFISFTDRVLQVVARIPKGTTLSYQQVAVKAGSPNAFRAVGSILKKNYNPSIPCHRVIRSDGKPGQYNGGDHIKIELLRKEGVKDIKTCSGIRYYLKFSTL